LGKVLRDLSLSKSIVQCVVDQLRLNTETRCRVTIDRHNDSRGIRLLISGDILQFRQPP
jgi:hypothetical protein